MSNFIDKHPVFEAIKIELERKIPFELKNFRFNKKPKGLNVLYHYTDIGGLKGIVENQCFFSSNSAYLNDKEEFYNGIKLFKNAVNEYTKELNDKLLIQEVLNELETKDESFHYVTCFSLEGDLLSQWRAYADDGKGIAIGFDLNNLIEAFKPKATGMLIEYNKNVQKQAVKKIVKTTVDFYYSKLPLLEKINQKKYLQSYSSRSK